MSLSSKSSFIRARWQAALYHSRKNRRGRSSSSVVTAQPSDFEEVVWHYAGDAADNETTTIEENFNPSDVNTSTDKITISLPSNEFTRNLPYDAMICQFRTTGTLPSPLAVDTDYIFEDNGDGTVRLFPVLTNDDYAVLPGHDDGEDILPFQAYACEAGIINLTDQGSGVHTLFTMPIFDVIKDQTGNGVDLVPSNGLASSVRLMTDEQGFKYIECPGMTGVSANNDNGYGKILGDNIDNTAFGALFDGKRYMAALIVAKVFFNTHYSMARAFLKPSDIDTSNGYLDADSHGIATGQAVEYGVLSDGGAFPTPTVAFAGTIYARSVNGNRLTLHPTEQDANDDTNKYIFSDSGSGIFYVQDPTDVQFEDGRRQFFFDVNVTANGHDFTPATAIWGQNVTTNLVLSHGRLDQVGRKVNIGRNFTSLKVKVYIPSGTVAPICEDTSLALTSGEYWMTAENDSRVRLHRTEALAEASVGTAAGSLTNTQVIKFDTTNASGNWSIHLAENAQFRQFNDNFTFPEDFPFIDYGQKGTYVLIQDYDDPSGKSVYTCGFNSIDNILDEFLSTDSNATLDSTSQSNLNLANADEPHVPGFLHNYESVFLVSDDLTELKNILTQLLSWSNAKYGF